jgi:xylose isomerase
VGNSGRDPFGEPVRHALAPTRIVEKLAELGAFGVNLHDTDLVPFDASPAERRRIVADFKKALDESGMKVPMATTNLFSDPVFKEGAFTANDAKVRQFALQKTMRAMDLGVELGAETYVFWGGREGVETNACKSPQDAIGRFRDCLNFLCEYARDNRYDLRFALEAKPNEPRGDIWLPTSGHMLAFIYTLDHPDMVGLNPEVAHEQMPGLDFSHAVGQALEVGKLFHIDLNGQKPGRYDQDLRFGSEDQKGAFFLVKLLEDAKWEGMRHFDSHAYRTEDEEGVWDFASASMRTYLILKEKVDRWHRDPEIRGLLEQLRELDRGVVVDTGAKLRYGARIAAQLKDATFDLPALRTRGYQYERLDQLTTEVLLGVR